ncbi:MAG: YHYH protein [Bacteroidota bacterium]
MNKYLFLIIFFVFLFGCEEDEAVPTAAVDEDEEETVVNYTASIAGEGSVSEDAGTTAFTVSVDPVNETGSAITLNYTLGGTATSGSDYEALSGSVAIANGQSQATVQLTVSDDSDDEDDETIRVTLASTGLPENVSIGTNSVITITITDNDDPTNVAVCSNDNSISTDNVDCNESATVSNSYSDNTINMNNEREITTNGVPEHQFRNQLKKMGVSLNTDTKNYTVSSQPSKSASTTSVLTPQNRPRYRFGVAKNGVPMDPAPAEPFIFENTSTGEYNWDWVFEPNNNADQVELDCAYAHFQPDGTYHYHGDMVSYANELLSGLGDGTTTPTNAVQVGWAADGFPVYYKYGPTNTDGTGAEVLSSSYQVKSGERSGDGVSEPCGTYNGKYTNDYEFVSGAGDLDACNGIDRSVKIGTITYTYFYVITESFPIIPRCLSGTPDDSFLLSM